MANRLEEININSLLRSSSSSSVEATNSLLPATARLRQYLDVTTYSPCYKLLIGRSFSSEAAKREAIPLHKVPDYLIPPAYRKRSPDDNNNRGRGGNPERNFAKRRSKSGGRTNRNISVKQTRKSKQRRKISVGHRRSFDRHKRDDNGENPHTDLQQLEKDLSTKMNMYHERLGEISFMNFGAYLDKNVKQEEADAAKLSNLKSSFFTSNYARQNDDLKTSETAHAYYLHATEDLYNEIASDLHNLIIGFTGIAEAACNAQMAQNRDTNDEEAESDSMFTHYIDAILKAERFLEAFETLYRNRTNAISKENIILEKLKQVKDENDDKVLGRITSFLGDVFLHNGNKVDDAFNESWNRADGKSLQSSNSYVQLDVEFTKKNTFYIEQLIQANHLAYCFGLDKKVEAVQRSNRLLNRWISINCLSQTQDALKDEVEPRTDGDKDDDPSAARELFHKVLRQNIDLWTVEGVDEAEEWIKQMHSLQQSGRIKCAPDVEAYNIVLFGYCNLCKMLSIKQTDNYKLTRVSKQEEKSRGKLVIERTEKLLTQLTEMHDVGINPNILSLNLALNALAKAGRDGDPDLCKTTNRVLLKVIGEENYRSVVGIENDPTKDSLTNRESASKKYVEPNLDTYHWLVDIYSSSQDAADIKLGLSLLKKMIQHRHEEQSKHRFRDGFAPSFAPSTGTYNNILRALVRKSDIEAPSVSDKSEIAKEATEFLDAMIQSETSYPTRVTFLFLLQLWRKTGSPEAGEYADQILSRMEMASMYQRDLKPFSNGYLLALDCWHTAATAGYVGAAERAFRLVQIIEGKSGPDLISDDQEFSEGETEGTVPLKNVYTVMMKICTATQNKLDTPISMAIAFKMLKRMEDNEMRIRRKTFERLYTSVRNFLMQHPGEDENDLMQKVFDPASRYGVTPAELKSRAAKRCDS